MVSRSSYNRLVAQTCERAVHGGTEIIIEHTNDGLFEFAKLVAAEEREVCAKVCDEMNQERGYDVSAYECAYAIRAMYELDSTTVTLD